MAAKGVIGILALTGAAIATAVILSDKEQAAEDLKIEVEHVDFNVFKNIEGGIFGRVKFPIKLNIRNIRRSTLNVQAIDLAIMVNQRRLAYLQDYKGFVINGVQSATQNINAYTSVANMSIVLGAEVIRAIGDVSNGQGRLAAILPKEVKIVGQIRAEGIVIDINEDVITTTNSKTPPSGTNGGTKK